MSHELGMFVSISTIISPSLSSMVLFCFGENVWLIANVAWMISECITRICGSISCQNQTILFFGFLKYCLSSSSCSNWCYLFSIFLTYYTNCSMIFIITGGELHSLQFSWCLCFIFLLFPLLSSSLLVAYGISSIFFVFCRMWFAWDFTGLFVW